MNNYDSYDDEQIRAEVEERDLKIIWKCDACGHTGRIIPDSTKVECAHAEGNISIQGNPIFVNN